jgi:putative flippase GtrA
MVKRELMLRVLRFGLVGGTVTLFFMGMNWLLAPRLGVDAAFLAAYPPTVLLHFCLNKWWTFRDQTAVGRRQISEYLLMTFVAFLIQAGGFKLLVHFTPMPAWLASGASTVAQMALAFFVMQLRVFASSRG